MVAIFKTHGPHGKGVYPGCSSNENLAPRHPDRFGEEYPFFNDDALFNGEAFEVSKDLPIAVVTAQV
jgi:hypothetical protein